MVGGHIGKKQDKASVIWHLISSLLPGYKQVERRTEEERQNTSWQRGKTREGREAKQENEYDSNLTSPADSFVTLRKEYCRKPHFANVSMFHIEQHPVIYTLTSFLFWFVFCTFVAFILQSFAPPGKQTIHCRHIETGIVFLCRYFHSTLQCEGLLCLCLYRILMCWV